MTFSQEAFNQWDEFGKQVVKDYLLTKGHIIVPNPDRYGVDLYSDKNGTLYRWEVEVKSRIKWTSQEDYPYDTVSFLGRKKKWTAFPFWYCIVCAETKNILFAYSQQIYHEEYEVRKYIQGRGEVQKFYHVPKHLCYWS